MMVWWVGDGGDGFCGGEKCEHKSVYNAIWFYSIEMIAQIIRSSHHKS